MPLSVGIVGLPNVGKSSLFKALTRKQIDIANYPFCTIEPNIGTVAVPDFRLEKLAKLMKPSKITPTIIEFVDIAGLVKDANKGEGLGNQFLANIREVDAICHVVRIFKNSLIVHVEKDISPSKDIETINTELILKDIETTQKHLEKTKKEAKSGDNEKIRRFQSINKILQTLNKGEPVATLFGAESPDEIKGALSELCLLSAKPMIYAFNEDAIGHSNVDITDIKAKFPHIIFDAKFENELNELTDSEIAELNLPPSALDQLINACYDVLNLISFFTGGSGVELKAWTINRGTKAPRAAGKIHTDFERGFIKAEVISYNNFVSAGSEAIARQQGTYRHEGKNYLMQDGDIVKFKFNT